MQKQIFTAILALSISVVAQAKEIEQTICFSQSDPKGSYNIRIAELGDNVSLNGGQCGGKTIWEMNQKGWRLIQVVTGLNSAFGMVFTKE